MSLSETAKATRYVLTVNRDEALSGELTTGRVVEMVQEIIPTAKPQGIYRAIEDYGPIGEDDEVWRKKAERPGGPSSWFYSPHTGQEVG